jgi:uncharacterized protein (TIGR02453 family)
MKHNAYITPRLFAFFRELAENNNRDWFTANKERYEADVREPLLRFIEDFAEHLNEISPYFEADTRKVGGSLFRIYRDVRFSKDKSPYKTHAGIHFRHESARDVHAPGYYLHLEPRECFIGVGIWHPDSQTLGRIRNAILDRPDAWIGCSTDPEFRQQFELSGESLKRAPSGVDPDHPLIQDLKRKDFVAVSDLTQKATCAPGFTDHFAETCFAASPFMEFLTKAIGLRW